MLDLKGIYKTFNPGSITEKKALQGIDLHLEDGDFVTIIGGNGAGKSTAIRTALGVYRPDSGSITLDGKPIFENPEVKNKWNPENVIYK